MSDEIVPASEDEPIEAEIAQPIAVERVKHGHEWRFHVTYALLAAVLATFIALFVIQVARNVRVVHTYSDRNVVDAKIVAASLHPRAVVDGANLGLPSGTVCFFGKNATGVFVVCPG